MDTDTAAHLTRAAQHALHTHLGSDDQPLSDLQPAAHTTTAAVLHTLAQRAEPWNRYELADLADHIDARHPARSTSDTRHTTHPTTT